MSFQASLNREKLFLYVLHVMLEHRVLTTLCDVTHGPNMLIMILKKKANLLSL